MRHHYGHEALEAREVGPRAQVPWQPHGRCSLSQGHWAPRVCALLVHADFSLLASGIPDLVECLWASHRLSSASVSPSVLWEPSLDGLKVPSGSHRAVRLQRVPRPTTALGSRGGGGGGAGPTSPGETHAVSGPRSQPSSACLSLLGVPNTPRGLAFGVSLLRRGMGHWPGARHLGQLIPGSGPRSAQTRVLLPDHPYTGNATGLSEVTRVKPPLGMWQGHMGVGPQGLFPRTGKRLDRDP